MEPDNYQQAWRAQSSQTSVTVDADLLLKEVQRNQRQFRAMIFWRDFREVGVALVMLPLWFYLGVTFSLPWTWYLTVPALLWVIGFFLADRMRHPQKPSEPGETLLGNVKESLTQVEHQIWLLRNVFWWYLLPFTISVLAFFAHVSWLTFEEWFAALGFATFLFIFDLAMDYFIYWLNQYAVRIQLEPRREELLALVTSLGDETTSEVSGEYPKRMATPASVERARSDAVAAAKSAALMVHRVVKWFALGSLIFALCVTILLLIGRALGAIDSGSLPGYLIYCVVNLLLAWGIYKAKPPGAELGTMEAAVAEFKFIALVVVIVFVMCLTPPALAFGGFDSGYLMYCIVTSLLALGIYRANSILRASVMLLLAVLAFIALAGGAFHFFHSSYQGTARSDGPAGASLAGLVTDLRKEHKLVGLAAMVMVDENVVACAADGERKKGSGVPIELGDRWHLGSITKSVTATMIARLVESGQMKWTDTVGERFAGASIHEDWKPVTLQQLLTHTSGAPANFSKSVMLKYPEFNLEWTKERRKAVIDVIAKKPAHPPGKKFAYSNVGYTIAGAMAESATGTSWEELVKREVFQPLELTGAGFGPPKSPSATLDQPRGHNTVFGWKVSAMDDDDNTPIIGPAGIVHMTLRDLCMFATEHLRGELGTGKLLDAETYKRLHTPKLQNYAYGWVVKQPTSEIPHTVYWHNGSNTMWYALVVFIPEKNMVVAVTSNDGDIEKAEAAAWEIVKAGVIDAAHKSQR
jgi:CubicO group peptidase (beta-lactamase class C family)